MSNSKHTPGPWFADVNEDMPNGYIHSPSRETLIAEIQSNGQTAFETMANAHLIAVAPELLEAFRR